MVTGTRRGALARTLDACLAKWTAEADSLRRLGAQVDGAKLIEAIVADFQAVNRADDAETLTLIEAARESGYSSEHLGKLLRRGTIPNAGRKNAPRIRRRHLPYKPSALREALDAPRLVGVTPGQIARAVVTSSGEPR